MGSAVVPGCRWKTPVISLFCAVLRDCMYRVTVAQLGLNTVSACASCPANPQHSVAFNTLNGNNVFMNLLPVPPAIRTRIIFIILHYLCKIYS